MQFLPVLRTHNSDKMHQGFCEQCGTHSEAAWETTRPHQQHTMPCMNYFMTKRTMWICTLRCVGQWFIHTRKQHVERWETSSVELGYNVQVYQEDMHAEICSSVFYAAICVATECTVKQWETHTQQWETTSLLVLQMMESCVHGCTHVIRLRVHTTFILPSTLLF